MKKLLLCILLLLSLKSFSQSVAETFNIRQEQDGTAVFTDYDISTDNGLRNFNYRLLQGDSVSQVLQNKMLLKYFSEEEQYNIQYNLRGFYVIAGYTPNGNLTGNPQDYNYWLIKLLPIIKDEIKQSSAMLFPNPTRNQTTLLVTKDFLVDDFGNPMNFVLVMYDILGNKVKHIPIKEAFIKIDVKDLAPGVYTYSIKSNKVKGPTGKFIVQ